MNRIRLSPNARVLLAALCEEESTPERLELHLHVWKGEVCELLREGLAAIDVSRGDVDLVPTAAGVAEHRATPARAEGRAS